MEFVQEESDKMNDVVIGVFSGMCKKSEQLTSGQKPLAIT